MLGASVDTDLAFVLVDSDYRLIHDRKSRGVSFLHVNAYYFWLCGARCLGGMIFRNF